MGNFDPSWSISRNRHPPRTDYTNMTNPLLTIHDLGPDHVVLHESLTEPFGGLELHVAVPGDRHGVLAWWMDEWGRLLRRVPIGEG